MQSGGIFEQPVKSSTSVVKTIIGRVEEALMRRELKPGDAMPSETEMAKSFGVGKSSIREAMKMLEAMGVVDIRQGEGTFIRREPTVDNINTLIFALFLEQGTSNDLLELRAMFEPAYTVMAMHRAEDADLQEIKAAIETLEQNAGAGTQSAEDDLSFHRAILKCTRNNFIVRIGETILQFFKVSIDKSVKSIPEVSIRDHKDIYEAFVMKDETKLREAIMRSYEGWMKVLNEG